MTASSTPSRSPSPTRSLQGANLGATPTAATATSTGGNVAGPNPSSATNPGTMQGATTLDLGTAYTVSPMLARNRNSRRSSLSVHALNAIKLNNDLAGELGTQIPLPPNAGRVLFSPAPKGSPPGVGVTAPVVAAPAGPPAGRTIVIDGRPMTLSQVPAKKDEFVVARLYDKTKRDDLDPEARQAFVDGATGAVLARKNRLRTLSTKEDDDGVLSHVHNLRTQLQTLKDHLVQYDLVDVFTIISPTDLATSGNVRSGDDGNPIVFDLFVDYSRLHKAEVASSNAWYNSWIAPGQPYVKENLQHSFDFLKNNTDETLWSKCLEEHDEFHPIQRGGPLMLFLLLSRIHNSSETAVEYLKTKVKSLKISKIQGENVETVVSLIKSAYNALLSASTPTRSYVPDDFAKTVLEVMQTSSHAGFTQVFEDEVATARRLADKHGGVPDWPSITETLNQAQNTYNRLVAGGEWLDTGRKRAPALHVSTMEPPRKCRRRCFNCDSEDHLLPDCPEPRDEAKIKANLQKFRDSQKKSKVQYKTAKDGRRLVLNSKGLYVHDVKGDAKKAKREAKKASKNDKLASDLTDTVTSLFTSLQPPSQPPATSPAPALTAQPSGGTLASHRAAIKAKLLAKLQG